MKKIVLIAIAMFAFTLTNAQTFGAKAGFNSSMSAIDITGFDDDSDAINGFYIGGFAEFEISEGLILQPELLFVSVIETSDIDGVDSESYSSLYIPIMFKYYVVDKFNVQAGPQITFSLEETIDDFSALGVDLALGLGYDITDNIFVDARYGYQLSNYYTGDSDGVSIKSNTLQIGLGYKFN